MVLVDDAAWGHHDGGDRVVHDFLLRHDGDAPPLAAPPQLPDQLGAALVQLPRRVLR